jgi:hypothetical protein
MSSDRLNITQQRSRSRKANACRKNSRAQTQRTQQSQECVAHDDTVESSEKGPIAMLQEFVQCSKAFPLPPSCSALQWTYHTRMASKVSLQYRASVAFFLEGVPHHAAGAWYASKKSARRDAADRALCLFVGRWGAELLQFQPESSDAFSGLCSNPAHLQADHEEKLLEQFCAQLPACAGGEAPKFTLEFEQTEQEDARAFGAGSDGCGRCFAIVELRLLGVPHKLAGALKATEVEARVDAARRCLWYLQCPGFEEAYEPEPLGKASLDEIKAAPNDWVCDNSSQEAVAEASRKTVLMRAQNRLQQAFARQLQARKGVWEWSFETDPNDAEWPPLFRAKVSIPVIGREFVGSWARGQRDAQIETVACLNHFLDEMARDKRP